MATPTFDNARAMIAALTPSYPVYCLRPAVIAATARAFLDRFPGRVLYAVKCNPHPQLLRALYGAGIRHFDTASLPEIAEVREMFPDAGAYFMHPVKSRAAIHAAYEVYGIRHFVIDHPAELAKVRDETGGEGVTIIVRLATPPAGAVFDLSEKFGADVALAADLLKAVEDVGCQGGLAFHVGSQCLTPEAYNVAIAMVGEVVEQAGTDIHFLDVGGGFPAEYKGLNVPPLADYMDAIGRGVDALGLRRDCVLMCEPGRAIAASSCSLVVQVLLRKDNQVYINDGIYGSLSEMVTAQVEMPTQMIRLDGEPSHDYSDFKVSGPTCDSLDVLPYSFRLADDVREGDWIEIGQVGAYGSALRTHFNGFYPDTFVELRDSLSGVSEQKR